MNHTPFPSPSALDSHAMDAARRRWATRAKPPGALGRLEDLAIHLAGVTGRCPPPVPTAPAIVVFAGDHGVVKDGASAWPSEITAAMVQTISQRGAAINAFADTIGADVTVIDVGVQTPLGPLPNVRNERIREGTNSIAHGPAMTTTDTEAAINIGAKIANEFIDYGADCLIGGDMGIGNTTPSAALISTLTGQPAQTVTGTWCRNPCQRDPTQTTTRSHSGPSSRRHLHRPSRATRPPRRPRDSGPSRSLHHRRPTTHPLHRRRRHRLRRSLCRRRPSPRNRTTRHRRTLLDRTRRQNRPGPSRPPTPPRPRPTPRRRNWRMPRLSTAQSGNTRPHPHGRPANP